MSWQPVSDAVTLSQGTRTRINIDVGILSIGVNEDILRGYISQSLVFTVSSVSRNLFGTKWHVEGTITEDVVVSELRTDITNLIAIMRSEWLIAAPGMYVDTIEISKTSAIADVLGEVPTSTTISLVAFAVLGIVAVWFVSKFAK